MGYYDVFLFDTDGNLVYSVFKELDYATNILNGEWRDTGLATVFRAANVAESNAQTVFDDFRGYAPSAGAPAAFFARPIFNANQERVGGSCISDAGRNIEQRHARSFRSW